MDVVLGKVSSREEELGAGSVTKDTTVGEEFDIKGLDKDDEEEEEEILDKGWCVKAETMSSVESDWENPEEESDKDDESCKDESRYVVS